MRAWGPGSAVAGTLPSATIARRPPAPRSRSPSARLRAAVWRTGSGWVGKPERRASLASPGAGAGSPRLGSPACAAPQGLSAPAAGGIAAGGERVKRLAAAPPLGSAPRSAPEPIQREDGDGGSERRARLWRAGGLGGHGSGNRPDGSGGCDPAAARRVPPWGWDEAVPGDLPPPPAPSALLLPRGGTGFAVGPAAAEPCPTPGKNREGRGLSLLAALPLPSAGAVGSRPHCSFPLLRRGDGRAAPVRGAEGAPLPVRLSRTRPPFPAASHSEGAAPRLSGRAEVLTAAGAVGPVRPGRGEMLLFNPLPGPHGAWLSPASREAFSAQRHRPFPPSRTPGVWTRLGSQSPRPRGRIWLPG